MIDDNESEVCEVYTKQNAPVLMIQWLGLPTLNGTKIKNATPRKKSISKCVQSFEKLSIIIIVFPCQFGVSEFPWDAKLSLNRISPAPDGILTAS